VFFKLIKVHLLVSELYRHLAVWPGDYGIIYSKHCRSFMNPEGTPFMYIALAGQNAKFSRAFQNTIDIGQEE